MTDRPVSDRITLAEYRALPDTVRAELRGPLSEDVAVEHRRWLLTRQSTRESRPDRHAGGPKPAEASARDQVLAWMDANGLAYHGADAARAASKALQVPLASARVYVYQWRKAHGMSAKAGSRPAVTQVARYAEAAAWLAVVPPREVWMTLTGRLSGVSTLQRYGPPRGRSVGTYGAGLDVPEFIEACAMTLTELGVPWDESMVRWAEASRLAPEPQRTIFSSRS